MLFVAFSRDRQNRRGDYAEGDEDRDSVAVLKLRGPRGSGGATACTAYPQQQEEHRYG